MRNSLRIYEFVLDLLCVFHVRESVKIPQNRTKTYIGN